MKTKLIRMMCALFAMMVCTSVNAQNYCGYPNEEDVTWELNGSQLIFSGTGAIKTYSTNQPTDYPWFSHMNNIQTVIIGEGITNIPDWAFAMYENLRSIHLPSTLKNIGNSSLEETNLWNVSLPEGLETIGHYAFLMCPFQSLCLPSTVTSIGQAAFAYCDALTSVGCYADTPPTFYDNTVFDDCSNIETVYVQSAKIADYKVADGWSDFGDKIQSPAGYCGPNGNDEDGDDDVTKATWVFDMSTHTLTISGTKLGQYNRPWDSAGMGGSGGGFNPDNNVGYPCGIYHLVIEEGIAVIPAMEFYMNLAIVDVTLPSTVTSIGMGAFGECFALESFTVNATTPPTLGDDVFMDLTTIPTIYVPAASVETYKGAAGWSNYAEKIVAKGGGAPTTTTTFAYTASEKLTVFDDIANFTGATAVKSHEFAGGTGTVVYEGTVTAIEDYTFRYDATAKSKMTSITLPASLTTTGEYTFWYCEALESVAFDGTPSLTTIGKSAFKECTALTTIAIPASVTSIGVSAFSGCTALASVTFTGTSSLTTINQSAFSGCTSLKSITLPESLTTLGTVQTDPEIYYNGSVFWNSGITSLNIPKNVSTIYGVGYFAGCKMTSLTVDADNATYADLGSNAIFEKATNKLVVGCNASSVPSGVTTIGFEAFWAITEPFSLTLPATVTTIEARAFHLASGLTAINIPEGVTAIEDETFSGCSLTTLVIPNTVTTIGGMAFDSCNELTSLTLGSEVTTIGGGAFSYCNKLTALEIPAKVTALEGAFSSGNLATIVVAAGNTKYDSRNNCNAIIDTESKTMLLGCKNTTFPDGVTKIGDGAFRSCVGLTTLNIPATVTEIGSSAFAYCSNITELTIPNTISVISSYAFQGCKKLTTVNIPDGVTTIEGSAFTGCSGLTTVTLGSGLTSIAQRSFANCEAVTDVYCYADPDALTWESAGLYWGYDFKDGKATLCHVADADAWPSTSSSDKFYKVNVTFVGDLNAFTLAEDVDNSAAITGRSGKACDVTLTRTLQAGVWNTLCLPFDVTIASSALDGAVAKTLTNATMSGSTVTLTFGDPVTTLTAGTPYIIKWTSGSDIVNPTFANVTIDKTVRNKQYDFGEGKSITFTGTYAPLSYPDENRSILFLGENSKLYYPNGDATTTIGALRAYFALDGITAGDPSAGAKTFVLYFGDDDIDGINSPTHSPRRGEQWFDMKGQQLNGRPDMRGIYINNGKKIAIK